jgi:peptidoglycan/LPS O-acetylase OafA/YrhL
MRCVLGAFLLIGTTSWKWLVQLAPLRFFGQISYGLYLIHLLIFRGYDSLVHWRGFGGLALRFVIAASASTLLSWLSRKYFENYFLQMKSVGRRAAQGVQALNEY